MALVTVSAQPKPTPFFESRVHDLATSPALTGLCVGYELGEWRTPQLIDCMIRWLPDFALSYDECKNVNAGNLVELAVKAAKLIYASPKYKKRGEFGEVLLHMAMREVCDTLPAVSKIYYKDSANNTVKGFDAVHVVPAGSDLELWLGEAKFYDNVAKAIASVVADLSAHTAKDFLRQEFILIANKISSAWPHADRLKRLLDPNVSLDTVFARTCIPVLLTYDSPCVGAHKSVTSAYEAAFKAEIEANWKDFAGKVPTLAVRVHLFLLPLKSKKVLNSLLDERLKKWQAM